jgi:hypothetical protein
MAGGGLPPGAPNALEEACAALASGASAVEDLYFQTEVTVTAEALLSSGEIVSGSSTFTPANGVSGETIILSGSGSPQLVNFEANPPNPIAGEGYLATADVILLIHKRSSQWTWLDRITMTTSKLVQDLVP